MKHLLLLTCLFLASVGFCQSELASAVMNKLEADSVKWHDELIVEKIDPNNENESILVLPIILEEDESSFWLNTWIVRVNNEDGTILNKISLSDYSDAIELARYEIDTAPYQLSSETRAFGIRTIYHGSSQVNPYTTEKLTLFTNDQNSFNQVLEDYEVDLFFGEWDGTCDGEFTHHKKILILMDESSNGFFDILIKTKIVVENTFYDEFNDCDSRVTNSSAKTKLRFENGKYQEIN